MRNKIFIYLFICILRTCYCYVQIPYNPCPGIFNYIFDGREWSGHIVVPAPPFQAFIAHINASFSIPGSISGYKNLVLDQENEAIDKIQNGVPLKFIASFPKSNFLPQVTNINWNGHELCPGPPVDPPSTWYSLTYTYNWTIVYSYEPIDSIWPVHSGPQTIKPRPITYRPTTSYPDLPIFTDPPQPVHVTETHDRLSFFTTDPPKPFVQQTPRTNEPVFTSPPLETSSDEPIHFKNYKECGVIRQKRSLKDDEIEFARKIINGSLIPVNSHPWLAAMFDIADGKFFCAGNLISTKHVLTAAHCVLAKKWTNIQVRLGTHNIQNLFDPGSQHIMVKNSVAHPEYKENRAHSDLAFLVLENDVIFNHAIKPICLWNYDSDTNAIVGYIATIMGWGKNEYGEASDVPMKTEVTITANQECKKNRLLSNLITDETFCAGGIATGPCLGDSGGGLFIKFDGKWYLRGIISTSIANRFTQICDTNSFSVYVDTAKYMNWIVNQMDSD